MIEVRLRVTDDQGLTLIKSKYVTINLINYPPMANAGVLIMYHSVIV